MRLSVGSHGIGSRRKVLAATRGLEVFQHCHGTLDVKVFESANLSGESPSSWKSQSQHWPRLIDWVCQDLKSLNRVHPYGDSGIQWHALELPPRALPLPFKFCRSYLHINPRHSRRLHSRGLRLPLPRQRKLHPRPASHAPKLRHLQLTPFTNFLPPSFFAKCDKLSSLACSACSVAACLRLLSTSQTSLL